MIPKKVFSFLGLFLSNTSSVLSQQKRPNFIICQPDDLRFFEEWTPPPHVPIRSEVQFEVYPEKTGLPNIDRLRKNGLQMMQAYTASPMCGTSRYSTLTGRYPSRSAMNRWHNYEDELSDVKIPNTKLLDVRSREINLPDRKDCSENNLAVVLKKHGYRTGVTGKWHLGDDNSKYSYEDFQDHVRSCGFDYAESLYAENMWSEWAADGPSFSHNMEYMTEKAVEFIQQADDSDDADSPFFLYFNPTVTHESGNVLEALTDYSCRQTCAGILKSEPRVKGMTDDNTSCKEYRRSVIERADGTTDNNHVGSIWVDDAIGALLTALEESNQLENTFFLFQMDHGQEGKTTLWEQGIRVAQFIHYPDGAFGQEAKFHGMVSTIDIAPTVMDYAGIDTSKEYKMDGKSWRYAFEMDVAEIMWNNNRCLFHEMDYDRSVRCGCYKYMEIYPRGTSFMRGMNWYGLDDLEDTYLLFNLCRDDEGIYDDVKNTEANDIKEDEPSKLLELYEHLQCHVKRTRADHDVMDFDTRCDPTFYMEVNDGVNEAFTVCFSGDTTVEVKERGVIKMKELQVGDQVLVEKEKDTKKIFETVYNFGHHDENMMGTYIRLLPSKLELSPDHMVYVRGKKAPVPASMVRVGDILSDGTRVDSIVPSIWRKGAYAPFTPSGKLLVNGISVSNYIAFQSSSTLKIGNFWETPFTYQWLAHAFNAPHRLWWRLCCTSTAIFSNMICHDVGDNQSIHKTKSGISNWVEIPLHLTQWILNQSFIMQIIFFLHIITIFSVLTIVESAFQLIVDNSFLLNSIMFGVMMVLVKFRKLLKSK